MSFRVELRGVTFRHGESAVLDGVSLTLDPGGVVVFGGRSGEGKSALLEICAGLLKPNGGAVLWNDEEITGMSKYDLYDRRKSIGYVFQVHALISNHTVFDNIALPLKCGTHLNSRQIRAKVLALMEELGISRETEKKFPETLNSAQLRSVALARALVNSPRLILLDEPLIGVDQFTSDILLGVLHDRWQRNGMSIIMAANSIGVYLEWGAKQFTLRGGHLRPSGDAFDYE